MRESLLPPSVPPALTCGSVHGHHVSAGPGGNVAPIYLDGTFYATTQHTEQVMMAKQPGGPWNLYANITVPWVTRGRREDPYMWVDTRGNWHIINHGTYAPFFPLRIVSPCVSIAL